MSGLEDFVPRSRQLEIAGRPIEIGPLRIRQIPAFASAMEAAAPLLSAGRLIEAVARHGDAMIEAVAVATDVEREWLGELLPDDFLKLTTAVIEVNADFFVRRLLPGIETLSVALEAAIRGAGRETENAIGERSLPGSSSEDTGSTKSSD